MRVNIESTAGVSASTMAAFMPTVFTVSFGYGVVFPSALSNRAASGSGSSGWASFPAHAAKALGQTRLMTEAQRLID